MLLNLVLKHVVSEKSNHVDKEHGGDALILVQEEGRELQIAFEHMKTGFNAILLSIKAKHVGRRKRVIIRDQEIASVSPVAEMFGWPSILGLDHHVKC